MAYDILIVEDELDIGRLLSDMLTDEGYTVRHVLDGAAAVDAFQSRKPSLVILDIWLGDSRFDGLKVLEHIRKTNGDVPVIMMSGHGTIETAVSAMKMGAYDFVEKPFKSDHLLLMIARALDGARLKRENDTFKKNNRPFDLLGTSSAVSQLRTLVDRVAAANSRVVLTGPPGCGKEVIARLIHERSTRKNHAFVVLNCALLTPDRLESDLFGSEKTGEDFRIGLLEEASRGTLLLDEVLDLSLETQGKMVRALQEQTYQRLGGTRKIEVDVRVLASSSKDMKDAVDNGLFREDLYYRLNVVPMRIPPLKERREDIPFFVTDLSDRIAQYTGLPLRPFSIEAMLALQSYDWPGNIRQLRNVIEWILIMASGIDTPIITPTHLPAEIFTGTPALLQTDQLGQIMELPLREAREHFEKDYLLAQVARFSGNISQTANFVGMERSALHRKLKNLHIDRER